jgi:GH24 family phage-related lysozyme (muramidase)
MSGWVAGAIAVSAVAGAVAAEDAADAQYASSEQQAAAARESTALGRERLAWEKERYAKESPWREALNDRAIKVSDAQLKSAQQSDALAKEYADYNRTTFRPLEQSIVSEAQAFDTPDRRQAAADSAMADVNNAFSGRNDALARRLAAEGVDVGSAKYVDAMAGQGVDQALGNASAAYNARKGVETMGHAMKMDAASLGRNLPSNQTAAAQAAITAGNSAVANATVPLTAAQQAAAGVGAGYDSAIRATGQAGNLWGNNANTWGNASSQQDAMWGALGQVAGSYLGKKG